MTEKLLTLKEASRLLSIPPEDVEKWDREGRLSAFHIGGEFLRFRREEIERFKRERIQLPRHDLPLQGGGREERYTFVDGIKDFFYFNGFYLTCLPLALLALWASLAF